MNKLFELWIVKCLHRYMAAICFLVVGLITMFSEWEHNKTYNYDSFGYHNYLPSAIIYNDLGYYNHMDSIVSKYRPTGNKLIRYGLHPCENSDKLCNKYPIGVALFQAPLFLTAHASVQFNKEYPADGYSKPYQLSTRLSSLLFAFFGLVILAHFLLRYFNWLTTSLVILCISFGTNFLNYSAIESGLSHPYLFFLYSAVLLTTYKWYKGPTLYNSILLGVEIGLCTILRPIDILIALIPILWGICNMETWGSIRNNIAYLGAALLAFIVIIIPQLFYWHYTSGNWIYFSYPANEFFIWNAPRIWDGLFSYRKGWFLYTPLALLACTGLIFMKSGRISSGIKYSIITFFVVYVYVVFSWNNWFYGWSFGARPMMQTYALLALPLAFLLEKILHFRPLFKSLTLGFFALLIYFNLFQNWQYRKGIISGDSMNHDWYWNNFMSTKAHPDNPSLLILQKEHDKTHGW
jgi:hypothetical protein